MCKLPTPNGSNFLVIKYFYYSYYYYCFLMTTTAMLLFDAPMGQGQSSGGTWNWAGEGHGEGQQNTVQQQEYNNNYARDDEHTIARQAVNALFGAPLPLPYFQQQRNHNFGQSLSFGANPQNYHHYHHHRGSWEGQQQPQKQQQQQQQHGGGGRGAEGPPPQRGHMGHSSTFPSGKAYGSGASSSSNYQGKQCACGKYGLDGAVKETVGQMELLVHRHETLGAGALGTIYHAYATGMGKCVALKEIVPIRKADNPGLTVELQVKFAQREVAALQIFASKDAKHVINMFDSELRNGRVEMVLELGRSNLKEHWQNELGEWKKIPQIVAKVMLSAAACLEEVHPEGAYLDIKPENFMCMDEARPCTLKLIDFNSFEQLKGRNDDTEIDVSINFADPRYASLEMTLPSYIFHPERHYKLSKKADIWSFGVMFYELIYGEVQAQMVRGMMHNAVISRGITYRKDAEGIVKAVLKNDVSFAKPGDGKMWKGIVDIMKQCLVVNPTKRPTAKEIRKRLTALLK